MVRQISVQDLKAKLDAGAAVHLLDVRQPEEHAFAALPNSQLLPLDQLAQRTDELEVARHAGIMAAKRTGDLIPLCHPLPITGATVDFAFDGDRVLRIEATVRVYGRTGVEMEALTAVSVAALTVYDMCKAVDRVMTIERVRLEEKSGGRSGSFRRGESPPVDAPPAAG